MIRLRLHKSPDAHIRKRCPYARMFPAGPGQVSAYPVTAVPVNCARIDLLQNFFGSLPAV